MTARSSNQNDPAPSNDDDSFDLDLGLQDQDGRCVPSRSRRYLSAPSAGPARESKWRATRKHVAQRTRDALLAASDFFCVAGALMHILTFVATGRMEHKKRPSALCVSQMRKRNSLSSVFQFLVQTSQERGSADIRACISHMHII